MAEIVIRQGAEGVADRARAFRLVTSLFSNSETAWSEVETIMAGDVKSIVGVLIGLAEVAGSMVMLLTDTGEATLEAIDRIETVLNQLNG